MRTWTWLLTTPAISLLLAAQTSESVVARGMEAFHQGRYGTALAAFEQARQLAPRDPRVPLFLALTHAGMGDCNDATAELQAQFEHVTDPNLRRLAGLGAAQCLLAAGRYNDLFPLLATLRSDYPADADVLYESAKVYNKAWNNAVYEMFRKTPASFRVNQLSAEVFEQQGRYADAATEYRKAIAKNPQALDLHFRLGRALLMQSHEPAALAEARREFEAELALNPADAVAQYEIGQILVAQQDPASAAPHFQKALELNPAFAEPLVALAKIRTSTKQYPEAIALLQRAVRLEPRMEAAHYALMLAYRDSGDVAAARREKAELDRLQKPPEGEFTDFLKKLGEKAPQP